MRKSIYILLALGALSAFASCDKEPELNTPLYPVEDETDDLTGVKVYIQELSNGNSHTTAFDSTPVGITMPEGDTVAFFVRLNRLAEEDIVVKAHVEGLPSSVVKTLCDQVTIKAGTRISDEDVRFVLAEVDDLHNLDAVTEAAVKLEVVGGDATVGKNLNTFSWTVQNRYSIVYLGTAEGLQQYAGADWTPTGTFSYPDRMVDGIFTAYSSSTSNAGLAFDPKASGRSMMIFDMGDNVTLDGLGFVPYLNTSTYARNWWGTAEVLTSIDNVNWNNIGTITFDEPQAATWQVIRFYEQVPVTARYFMVYPLLNYGQFTGTYAYGTLYFSEAAPFGDQRMRGIKVSPDEPFVRVGKTIQLTATKVPSTAPETAAFTWSSSNESVATVDQDGVVTGIAPGLATIYATANGFEGRADLHVRAAGSQAFTGNYTMTAAITSSATATPYTRHLEIQPADDSHVTLRFLDTDLYYIKNNGADDNWAVGTLPFEQVDEDHFRITWVAGTPFGGDFRTASGLEITRVYACLFRGTSTGNSYKNIDGASVDLEFAYDEISGSYQASFGETHDWTYPATGIGLSCDYVNAKGVTTSNYNAVVMWGAPIFRLVQD